MLAGMQAAEHSLLGMTQNTSPLHTASASYHSDLPFASPVQPSMHPPALHVASSATLILPHLMHGNPSAETKAKALCGEYVVLEEFASHELLPPCNTMEPYTDSCGTLALRPKHPKKILDIFDKWLAAWSNYELLLGNNGYSYAELSHHRATIQHVNRKYHWPVIYTYDIKYWLACADSHSLDFS